MKQTSDKLQYNQLVWISTTLYCTKLLNAARFECFEKKKLAVFKPNLYLILKDYNIIRRSQWPRGLRRRSAAASLLRS